MRKYKTALHREPLEIDDVDYAMVELCGKERDEYIQQMQGRMRFTASGKPAGLKNFEGLQASLLTRTLHRATLDKTDTDDVRVVETHDRVSALEVQGWGSKMQTELFLYAQELCGMGDDAEDEAKND